MRLRVIPATALAFLTFCSPGNNRRDRETGMARVDSTAPSGETAPAPVAILSQLNLANITEIQLGQLASRKATSPEVKLVARKLATDHTRNRQELRALAQKLNLRLTPVQGGNVASDSTSLPADLQGKSGAEFDKAFVQHEIRDHQTNIDKIRNQMLPLVQDQQIKAYLQKTVTDMEGHLAALERVDQQISG